MRMISTQSKKSLGWPAKAGRCVFFSVLVVFFMIAMAAGSYAAVSVKQGTFNSGTATGNVNVTGVGFQPKAVIFYWTRQTAAGFSTAQLGGMGFASASPSIQNRSVSIGSDDNVATTNTGRFRSVTYSIYFSSNGTPTASGRGAVTAFGADGFTVNWNQAPGANSIIHYIALGGTSITDAVAGDFTLATGTGTQGVTGLGFKPDFILFLSSLTENADTGTAGSELNVGFVDKVLSQAGSAICGRDARTATTHAGSLQRTDNALVSLNPGSCTAIDNLVAVSSLDADGFTLDKTTATTGIIWNYLAIKGGLHKVGTITQPTTGAAPFTTAYTGVGFQPIELFFASFNRAAATAAQVDGKLSLGGAQSTAARGAIWLENRNIINSDANMNTSTTKIITLATTATVNADADLSSFNADGFTLNWTTRADTTARQILYWALGQDTTPPSVGTISLSPDANNYTSNSPTINAQFTDNESDVTGCEYTTNGSSWIVGALSGSSPTWTCTANATGLSGSVIINMRATSDGGTGTGTQQNRTVDTTSPTDGSLTITIGGGQNNLSWTSAIDAGIGLRTGSIYNVRFFVGPSAPTCSSGTSIYTGDLLSYTHTDLTSGQQYSYRVCAYDRANNASPGVTGSGIPKWPSTTTNCGSCHSYPPLDGTRSGATGSVVGSHQPHTKPAYVCSVCHNSPATTTSADYGHRNRNIQMQSPILTVGSYTKGTSFLQTNNPTLTGCSNIACHGGNNPTPVWGGGRGTATCVTCHNGLVAALTASMITGGTVTNRRPIIAEFNSTWSHKRSASPAGTVTPQDCGVCHMEGSASTGFTNLAYHANGYIELRDPDNTVAGGAPIKAVTGFSGTPGSYTINSTATTSFVRFNRNLNSTLESDPNFLTIAAIQMNLCLGCHDNNGALSPDARVPGGSAEKPFATTIAGTGYTGAGVTANGVTGGVTDINESFKTTNSSYHPVSGKQNNWYSKLTRMVSPWNTATRGGTADITSWGDLISCWDCHALSSDTGTISKTVTAHGAAATLRGNATVSGTPVAGTNESTLCKVCHFGYDTNAGTNHGGGSAFNASGSGVMQTYLRYGCNMCHASGYNTAVLRPIRGIDVHGSNTVPASNVAAAAAKTGRWAVAGAVPIAFIRNASIISNHQPLNIGGTPYSPQCMGGNQTPCSRGLENYSVGGVY